MSFEWKHGGIWAHQVRLTDGTVLTPDRIVLDSAERLSSDKVVPALFCETKSPEGPTYLRWIRWDEVESVHSEKAK